MSELNFQPIKGRAREILKAILVSPEVSSCSKKVVYAFRLACEEIVMNITGYAYPEDFDGFLSVEITKTDRITIRFIDAGIPFNPLKQEKPDTTLSWKLRRIGGLGILLINTMMDDVQYEYKDNHNVLTIEKKI
ncbi:MAG: ATP-binding protein [Bacteroidaceae bacterium]|nr:ATP-binding protein [Bacteroidaceae bacterium]